MTITAGELLDRLRKYTAQIGNSDVEVLIQYDGDVALEFSHGTDETVFTPNGGVDKFLVLRVDQKSKKKLKLKGSI